jgi:hypothetical protein
MANQSDWQKEAFYKREERKKIERHVVPLRHVTLCYL